MTHKNKQLQAYNFYEAELKWQKKWNLINLSSDVKDRISYFDENDIENKFYVLEMLPYPSGVLHMGHIRNYSIGDVVARFKRMQKKNVLYTIGWDAFGLPAENAAIENGLSPKVSTQNNISQMKNQLKQMGFSYEWEREVDTSSPSYYKHEQEMFLQMYKMGLAYYREANVNWDPVDCTVLANEQVVNGRGWRSNALVEQKKLKQWFLNISSYSEELLDGLDNLPEWSDQIKTMQSNWIGKSIGAEIVFKISNNFSNDHDTITVFSTHPETLFGCSFVAISLSHNISVTMSQNNLELKSFIDKMATLSREDDTKHGFFTGLYVDHPFSELEVQDDTGKIITMPLINKIPVYVANFVLDDYGTGAIFGCPAHDERDFDFAVQYNLPIKNIILAKEQNDFLQEVFSNEILKNADLATVQKVKKILFYQEKNMQNDLEVAEKKSSNYNNTEQDYSKSNVISDKVTQNDLDNVLCNSFFLNGMSIQSAKSFIIKELVARDIGHAKTSYRLHDWGISRQRYWGCPIPIIHCDKCGIVPEKSENLPVELPDDAVFDGKGNPLEKHPSWKNCVCHLCGNNAVRETDTFDTFFESSWYFIRYISPHSNIPFEKQIANRVLPVDEYIGGIEHAILHLLYARFFTKILCKMNLLTVQEPFARLTTQGMVCHRAYKKQNGEWVHPDKVEITIENSMNTKFFHKDTKEELVDMGVIKMSKSKKNVVNPSDVIETFGADAMRLFVLSDTPVGMNCIWDDSHIKNSSDYINRLWKMSLRFTMLLENLVADKDSIDDLHVFDLEEFYSPVILMDHLNDECANLIFVTHNCIKNITNHIEAMEFNKAIANLHTLSNTIEKIDWTNKANFLCICFALYTMFLLLAPFTPHLVEEVFERIGHEFSILKNLNSSDNITNLLNRIERHFQVQTVAKCDYPKYSEVILQKKNISVAVQINGKLRGVISVSADANEEYYKSAVYADKRLCELLENSDIRKFIVVPKKVVSIVTNTQLQDQKNHNS